MLRDAKIPAERCLSRRCAQADNHLRPKCTDFGVKPWATRGNFRCVRFLMDAPLPSRLPLEMFHRIRNINFPAVDSGFDESGIEQFAGRADKRFAFQVFLVTRLLTHEQDLCVLLPFSEHGLCRSFPKITSLAIFGGFLEFFKRPSRPNPCVCRTG